MNREIKEKRGAIIKLVEDKNRVLAMKFSKFLQFISINIEIINLLLIIAGIVIFTTYEAPALCYIVSAVLFFSLNIGVLMFKNLDYINGTKYFSR